MGTTTAWDKSDAVKPASPFAMAAWVGSDTFSGSTTLNAATFVVSNAVRNIILAGIAPPMTVLKPLYKPGIPSAFKRPLITENAFLSVEFFETTCSLVFTTEIGYSATVIPENIPAPTA